MKQEETTYVRRNYKDTVFRMLYRDKENLLELYNAVSGAHYTDAEELQIVTLENAVYMSMKNDVAFLVDIRLNLYEHQSTVNPNMPLRFLQYVAKEYEALIESRLLYGRKPVALPEPRFVVFYNGTEPQPDRVELKLSDLYQKPRRAEAMKMDDCTVSMEADRHALELKVVVLNINPGRNEELLGQCQSLREYGLYCNRVRNYALELPLSEAVERAVDECIREGILKEFLLANKAEVKAMSIFEYDEEGVKEVLQQQWKEIGREEGIREGLREGHKEGEDMFAALTERLIRDSRTDDLLRAAQDAGYRESLYQEYGIKKE